MTICLLIVVGYCCFCAGTIFGISAIEGHRHEQQRRGIEDLEAVATGYREYFEKNGRVSKETLRRLYGEI